MSHAFLCCNGNLLADDSVCTFVGAVLGAVADCKGIDLCLLEELNGIERVRVCGVCCKDVVLDSCQDSKLSFYGDSSLMSVLDDLTGKLDVLLERKR